MDALLLFGGFVALVISYAVGFHYGEVTGDATGYARGFNWGKDEGQTARRQQDYNHGFEDGKDWFLKKRKSGV